MTFMECAGSTLLAFGPPFVMFLVTIASDPIRIIIMIVSAFFWLMSLLISGVLWFAVVPLRDTVQFGVVFSVAFQEGFRFLLYLLIRKAERGLQQVADGHTILADNHRDMMAYVCGFGYGIMSGAFGVVNVIRDCWGPGTVGLRGDPTWFFPTSAALALAFILLHTCWGVVFFHGLATRRYPSVAAVVLAHYLVSGMTFFNDQDPPLYYVSIPVAYFVLLIFAAWAFRTAGGTVAGLKAALRLGPRPLQVVHVDAEDSSARRAGDEDVDSGEGGFSDDARVRTRAAGRLGEEGDSPPRKRASREPARL